jgi:hypothetical protein
MSALVTRFDGRRPLSVVPQTVSPRICCVVKLERSGASRRSTGRPSARRSRGKRASGARRPKGEHVRPCSDVFLREHPKVMRRDPAIEPGVG